MCYDTERECTMNFMNMGKTGWILKFHFSLHFLYSPLFALSSAHLHFISFRFLFTVRLKPQLMCIIIISNIIALKSENMNWQRTVADFIIIFLFERISTWIFLVPKTMPREVVGICKYQIDTFRCTQTKCKNVVF